ncbi:hypothetical protein B0H13DRAFT_1996823 [Mycena leptocephala]|nr:hypothetical protein B0H13DRAFT_1996823 [Mycena leptocephala]
MWLNLISSATVSQSIAEKTELFNTSFLDPALLPPSLATRIPTALPDPRATFYGRWIDLIVRLRNIDPNVVRTLTLTPYYAKTLLTASTVAMLTGKISNLHKDDLLDPSPFDHLFPKPAASEASPPRYFARYDAASPKDSPLDAPLTSPSAVVAQLATSQRSHNSLSDALALDSPIHIYFMPWDETMDTRREYPIQPAAQRVTAMNHLLEGIARIHGEIMVYSVENGTKESFDKEGFVFDVYVHRDAGMGEVQLLELNPFGIASGCGSCLFNWVTDAETLYGNKEEIEVRLSI